MTIGVISFQGDFQRHIDRLASVGATVEPVRTLPALGRVDAVVIPGGESTTIGMLLDRFGMLTALRDRIRDGLPVFATCAGTILLADDIANSTQPRIGGLDITVRRNAYGRQVDSFEADLAVSPEWSDLGLRDCDSSEATDVDLPVRGVFIRAPMIVRTGESVRVLMSFEGHPVLVQAGAILAATFHPEMTTDLRIHRYFRDVVAAGQTVRSAL